MIKVNKELVDDVSRIDLFAEDYDRRRLDFSHANLCWELQRLLHALHKIQYMLKSNLIPLPNLTCSNSYKHGARFINLSHIWSQESKSYTECGGHETIQLPLPCFFFYKLKLTTYDMHTFYVKKLKKKKIYLRQAYFLCQSWWTS